MRGILAATPPAVRGPRSAVRGLRRDALGSHALDPRAERAQPLVDPLVAAVDLADVADLRLALGAERGDEHRHAGADVGALHALAAKPPRAADDRPVPSAEDDPMAHRYKPGDEGQPAL